MRSGISGGGRLPAHGTAALADERRAERLSPGSATPRWDWLLRSHFLSNQTADSCREPTRAALEVCAWLRPMIANRFLPAAQMKCPDPAVCVSPASLPFPRQHRAARALRHVYSRAPLEQQLPRFVCRAQGRPPALHTVLCARAPQAPGRPHTHCPSSGAH